MNPNDIFVLFASLVGFPAFVAAVVNTLKYFNVLIDGQAPKVVLWFTIAGFVLTGVLFFMGQVDLLTRIDAALGSYALFLITFVSFIGDLGLAKLYNLGLKGTPVIGKSFTK